MRSASISFVSFLVACSGNSLDVGSDAAERGEQPATTGGTSGEPAQGGSSNGGATATAGAAAATAGTGAFGASGESGPGGSPGITSCSGDFPFVGNWKGNVLDYFFEPVEEVRLSLSEGGAGGISGTITWGQGATPPPASDAEATYPPGYEPSWGGFDGAGTAGAPAVPSPWPGFAYTIDRGAACDSTFRFAISSAELWESWCALQRPVYTEGHGWNITLVGNGRFFESGCEYTAANGESATYSPAQCSLSGNCACDQQSCRYAPNQGPTFELAFVGGDADVLTGDDGTGQRTIRLERAQ